MAAFETECAKPQLRQHLPSFSGFSFDKRIKIYKYNRMSELIQFKAEFFKALAHPLRIRILDELRSGEAGVNDLCARLNAEQSTLSQQLAALRHRSIVVGRKEGQNVYYSVRDAEIFALLDAAKKIFNNHLVDMTEMLSELTLVK